MEAIKSELNEIIKSGKFDDTTKLSKDLIDSVRDFAGTEVIFESTEGIAILETQEPDISPTQKEIKTLYYCFFEKNILEI